MICTQGADWTRADIKDLEINCFEIGIGKLGNAKAKAAKASLTRCLELIIQKPPAPKVKFFLDTAVPDLLRIYAHGKVQKK